MKTIRSIWSLILILLIQLPVEAVAVADEKKDSLFFESKKELMTAFWEEPFSWNAIRSNHAPLGPIWGTEMWEWLLLHPITARR